jgi:hypothetical protein
MTRVRLAPDLVCSLGAEQLERDGAHRRDRGELDQPFRFDVGELSRRAGYGFEPGDE